MIKLTRVNHRLKDMLHNLGCFIKVSTMKTRTVRIPNEQNGNTKLTVKMMKNLHVSFKAFAVWKSM